MADYTGEIVPDKEAQDKFIRENVMKQRGKPPTPEPAVPITPQEKEKQGFMARMLRSKRPDAEAAFNMK